jgi:hypothetical protein
MGDRIGGLMLAAIVVVAGAFLSGCAGSTEARGLKPVIINLGFNGADPDLTLRLEEGIALLPEPPSSPEDLAKAYRSAVAPAQVKLAAGKPWAIISAGPLLDSPDTAQVRKASLENHTFRIEIAHTNARLLGAGFRRNQPWRPLMKLLLEPPMSPGAYRVEVIWQAVESLPAGKDLEVQRHLGPISFTVADEG